MQRPGCLSKQRWELCSVCPCPETEPFAAGLLRSFEIYFSKRKGVFLVYWVLGLLVFYVGFFCCCFLCCFVFLGVFVVAFVCLFLNLMPRQLETTWPTPSSLPCQSFNPGFFSETPCRGVNHGERVWFLKTWKTAPEGCLKHKEI